ncbi:hypothetical protein ABZ876_14110 [Streptomyces sp. NPDC046931]|uniref:hypothetical protein n=1 Tax=Streptomyces sp. NPDC046931 TaxID=3154806 RepID=UPI0033C0504D
MLRNRRRLTSQQLKTRGDLGSRTSAPAGRPRWDGRGSGGPGCRRRPPSVVDVQRK